MKKLSTICLMISILGCSDNLKQTAKVVPQDSIVVGMTYDNVEKYLGRPVEIVRGFTEIKVEAGLPGTDASLLLSHSKEAVLYPSDVETKGQLVCVGWRYKDFVTDSSASVTFPVYTMKPVGNRVAYIFELSKYGKREVFEDDYNSFKAGEVVETDFNADNRIQCSKPPKNLDARFTSTIVKKYTEHVTTPAVVRTEQKFTYYVTKQYTVLFDASSGRLTDKGYYPIAITRK